MIFVDPVEVESRDGYRIWVRYEDGVEGELDLSHLAGKGVFKAWDDRAYFEGVHINEEAGCVCWGAPPGSDMEIDIAPETSYARLLGINTRTDCGNVRRGRILRRRRASPTKIRSAC